MTTVTFSISTISLISLGRRRRPYIVITFRYSRDTAPITDDIVNGRALDALCLLGSKSSFFIFIQKMQSVSTTCLSNSIVVGSLPN